LTATIPPYVVVVPGSETTESGTAGAPTLISLAQSSGIVTAAVLPPTTTGALPFGTYNLYRSTDQGVTWDEIVIGERVSPFTNRTNIQDKSPQVGVKTLYRATIVDTGGNESNPSNAMPFTPFTTTPSLTTTATLSAAAFGPIPVLGSDVLLDPLTREGVVGANGDFQTVNGLACLAQDLRIKLLIVVGQLLLDKTVGLAPIIGSPQANPVVEAQIVRNAILDVLLADPRVYSVLSLTVTPPQANQFGWQVQYQVMARNAEDPNNLSQVYPYFNGSAT